MVDSDVWTQYQSESWSQLRLKVFVDVERDTISYCGFPLAVGDTIDSRERIVFLKYLLMHDIQSHDSIVVACAREVLKL